MIINKDLIDDLIQDIKRQEEILYPLRLEYQDLRKRLNQEEMKRIRSENVLEAIRDMCPHETTKVVYSNADSTEYCMVCGYEL